MSEFIRAAPSADLAAFVQRRYEFAELRPIRDLGGGYNLNLLAESDRGALVVRVYGDWVSTDRLAAIQDVREHLRVRNWPIAPLLRPPGDAGSCMWNGRPVEVERFMAGGTRMNSWPLLTAEMLAARLQDAAAVHLPTCLVHGDFWDNNVYFHETEPVRIGDFDFMGERARIDDLALTMFFASEHFGRQDPTRERLDHLRALVDAFDGALADGLDQEERAALPYAIARSPLTFLRDIARQGWPALDELRDLRGPEFDWANRMLDSPAWLHAFR